MSEPTDPARCKKLLEAHPRAFRDNRYVYVVLSRRSAGISIGVNLNRDKRCTFDCVYCQVDRTGPVETEPEPVDLARLADELEATVELVTSGRLYEDDKFRHVPPTLRRLNDIALSGDGEPTACREFADAVALCAEVRRRRRLDDVKLILLTNACLLDRDRVRLGLETLDSNGGEIWAKLDAGTEAYYRRVARSSVPFERILENLQDAARACPIVIQSLFMRIHGEPPAAAEQEAYCRRLSDIVSAEGRIKLVQLHTIARKPSESWVAPLSNDELDALADLVRRKTQLPVAVYYGRSDS